MPGVLTLSHISYSYPSSPVPTLEDVSASFGPGWTGVVGANGCGKSTLARIACGHMKPDCGSMSTWLSGAYCEQDARIEPPQLYDFACDYAPEACRLRRSLNIADDMLWRFERLSCGEQKKIQLAVALWLSPELLVVDEPTNHVDAVCREEILRALRRYRGVGILVSHDRELLDALVYQVLSFEDGCVRMRPGSYSAAHAQEQIERAEAAKRRDNARYELHRLEGELLRRRQGADRSAGQRSARSLDRHDSDGRAKIGLAVVSGKDGSAARLAARMDARAGRARQELAGLRVGKVYEGGLRLGGSPSERKVVLRCEEQVLPCGSRRMLVPQLFVGSTDHVGVCGPNGIGKSTLIRKLLCKASQGGDLWFAELDGVRTLYLGQELGVAEARSMLRILGDLSPAERGSLLSAVTQLGSDPKRLMAGEGLSPGELRKLALAYGATLHPQLIVLDEPTNHLDVHSIEALERALAGFPGALVLVSHDRRFLKATTNRTIELSAEGTEEVSLHLS